jgi:hypothetical protein
MSTLIEANFDYIRDYYQVPARLRGRVRYEGRGGTIIGAKGQYLRVQLDDETTPGTFHPTWHLTYTDAATDPEWDGNRKDPHAEAAKQGDVHG